VDIDGLAKATGVPLIELPSALDRVAGVVKGGRSKHYEIKLARRRITFKLVNKRRLRPDAFIQVAVGVAARAPSPAHLRAYFLAADAAAGDHSRVRKEHLCRRSEGLRLPRNWAQRPCSDLGLSDDPAVAAAGLNELLNFARPLLSERHTIRSGVGWGWAEPTRTLMRQVGFTIRTYTKPH
jgi:hypothetical protein